MLRHVQVARGARGGWERRRPRNRLLGDLNPLTFRPSKKMDLIQTQPTPKTSGASLRYIPGYVPMPFMRRELHLVIENGTWEVTKSGPAFTTFNPQWRQIAPPVGTLQGQTHRPPPGARAVERLASQGPMGSNPRGTRPGRGHSVEKSFFKGGFL